MGHKADKSFFTEKRHWSERKDEILSCYLVPYLAKLTKKIAPILIADTFAGPGVFEDGNPGSPLIICNVIAEVISQNPTARIKAICIEPVDSLYAKLNNCLETFPFAKPKHGTFEDYLPEIARYAETHTLFLYVDPFTVEGLNWDQMDAIFQHIDKSKMSIEILMNFNASSFARRALAALKLNVPECNPEIEDNEEIDIPIATPPSIEKLNSMVGGNWWESIISSSCSFPDKVQKLTDGFCEKLSIRFNEVCHHGVKALPHHTVPKYYLIFASPHPDALILMNDQMVKSQRVLADLARPDHPTLFETRPLDLVPDPASLPPIILKYTKQPTARKTVITAVIREVFCQYAYAEIRGQIESMLKTGELKSETGKTRINDSIKIYATSLL